MPWFEKKIAINMDTGEQLSVIVRLSDFDYDFSPTMFFNYFDDAPIHNAITQCLDTLDMTEYMQHDLPEEETKKENITCLPVDEREKIRGACSKAKSFKRKKQRWD